MGLFDKFKRKLSRSIDKKLSPRVVKRVTASFEKAKKAHIKDIVNDEVCKEIKAGLTRQSKFLPINSGDLFSFFGFPAGSDPVGALEAFLENNITIQFPQKVLKDAQLKAFISYPSRSDFEIPLFELRWQSGSGGSWVNRVEDGIPGLSKYAPIDGKGLSGGGLQLKADRKKIQSASFGGVPFITKFHKKIFFDEISRIKF